jgi:uncharacterized metal-binding protein YceD (DUF177 family)
MDPKRIPINELMHSEIGKTNEVEVNVPEMTDFEVEVMPDQKLTFEGMKIEDGVCFYPVDQTLRISFNCNRCLKKVETDMELRPLEKQYYMKIPEDIDDDLVQQIDKKNHEIDFTPLINEVVYLSLPAILTCEGECQGPPAYKQELGNPEKPVQKPFGNLKNMIK